MLIERTGNLSAVLLLENNDCREEQFLLLHIRKTLGTDKNKGYSAQYTSFERNGKALIFVELKPCAKLYCFDDSDSFIDAVHQLGRLCVYCELLSDRHKVYIKSCNPIAWKILSEYGRSCDENKSMYFIGGQEVFDRISGG